MFRFLETKESFIEIIKVILFLLTIGISILLYPITSVHASKANSSIIASRSESIPEGNHIFFYNIETDALSSDMILLESNGRWGLIDAGHRYESTITDEDGTVYSTDVSNLSCQTPGKNGRDAMEYMIQTLGVDHLDFIIATHSHSDHIGGIPELADISVFCDNGEVHPLIDNTTVYFYKSYYHTEPQDDDLGPETIPFSWHNQAFLYQAICAINKYGGKTIDVSCGVQNEDGKEIHADQSANLSVMIDSGNFENISYRAGSYLNQFDDKISFQWNDMGIDLYHLFPINGAKNENVNSLVAVITCNEHKAYLAGDLNTQFQVEQKTASIIAADHGHFDLMKISHHGYAYSNSRELIDSLQPQKMILTNHRTDLSTPTISGDYSSLKYYSKQHYNSIIYGVGASDRMLEVDFDTDDVTVMNVADEGLKTVLLSGETCEDTGGIQDGWSKWNIEYYNNSIEPDWFYFVNNKALTGWQQISHAWYYFDPGTSIMQTGWKKDSKGWCYLLSNGKAAQTQWISWGGDWYYINSDYHMAANVWQKDSQGWCYLLNSGKATKEQWISYAGDWYYIKNEYHMAANIWQKDSHGWCFLLSNGKACKNQWVFWTGDWYYIKNDYHMAANTWQKDSQGWCYLLSDGKTAKNQWISWSGNWYYFGNDCRMIANTSITINGRTYKFDAEGRWISPL